MDHLPNFVTTLTLCGLFEFYEDFLLLNRRENRETKNRELNRRIVLKLKRDKKALFMNEISAFGSAIS